MWVMRRAVFDVARRGPVGLRRNGAYFVRSEPSTLVHQSDACSNSEGRKSHRSLQMHVSESTTTLNSFRVSQRGSETLEVFTRARAAPCVASLGNRVRRRRRTGLYRRPDIILTVTQYTDSTGLRSLNTNQVRPTTGLHKASITTPT